MNIHTPKRFAPIAVSMTERPNEDANRGPSLVIINATFTAMATLTVILRIIARAFILKKPGLDDAMIVAATILAILNVVVSGLGVTHGTGKHTWALNPSDAVPAAKLRFITHIIYVLASGSIEISISLLYLRLFPTLRGPTLATIGSITAMTTAIFLATIFQCSPLDAVYNPRKYAHAACLDAVAFWSATAALYLLTDVWVLVLPVPTILGLQASRRKRLVLTALLSLGAFACIASIARMVYIVRLYRGVDQSWHSVDVSIWSGVELALGIVAASVPSLRPVLDQLAPGVLSSVGRSRSRESGAAGQRRLAGPFHEDISLVRLTGKGGDGGCGSSASILRGSSGGQCLAGA